MNLIEIMIVVGIMVGLMAIVVPIGLMLLRLDQKAAASELANRYERIRDEAILRNLTFRLAFHLDENYYEVEVSEDPALLFADPDKRKEFEAALQEKMERQARRRSPEEGGGIEVNEDGLAIQESAFSAVQDKFLKRFELPDGTRFGGVYTPAYGELVRPSVESPEELREEDKKVVYAYVLPSGRSEHAVVHLVRSDNEDVGWTVEIEPMTGQVNVVPELQDWRDRYDFVPKEGPELSQ
jgi:type II secretory pathway pseudopilin PulG